MLRCRTKKIRHVKIQYIYMYLCMAKSTQRPDYSQFGAVFLLSFSAPKRAFFDPKMTVEISVKRGVENQKRDHL